MVADPHRILWVGTGTKTGKTTGLAVWLGEGIMRGERCAWIGPYHKRTRTGFEHIANAFALAERAGHCKITRGSEMRVECSATGGVLECFSGDSPNSIYGDGFNRVVCDEATRMKAAVLPAVLSIITATRGKVRFAFNLDEGRKHWAIQGFLNARAGADPEHGYIFLTTAESKYVDAATIDSMRRTLPDAVFRALYLGEIQEDGAGVFRNVEALHAGALEGPDEDPNRPYVMGLDLARKNDWTVALVFDAARRHVVAFERFHNLPWNEICNRIEVLAHRYRDARVIPDATGVGDPVVEELSRRGVNVEPVIITGGRNLTETGVPKTTLIQNLMVETERRGFTFPAKLEVLTNEMQSFEYGTTAAGSLVYSAPDGMNDDAVMALALAVWGARMTPGSMKDAVFERSDFDPRGSAWAAL
jgi:hypothetical protein